MCEYTFTDIFTVKRKGPVFALDLLGIMEDLEKSWPGVELKPAKIGGFEFVSWPGSIFREYSGSAYKSLLIHGYQWPIVDSTTRYQWARRPNRIIFMPEISTSSVVLELSLRALHGAPVWTMAETMAVARVFKSHGFLTRNQTRRGIAKKLVLLGPLGIPLSRGELPIMVD